VSQLSTINDNNNL